MLTVVVLPAPLCPSNAHTAPVGTEKLTSVRAGTPLPNVFARLTTSITGSRHEEIRPTSSHCQRSLRASVHSILAGRRYGAVQRLRYAFPSASPRAGA